MTDISPNIQARSSTIRVLLVEDDWAFRNIITRQLRKLGCFVQSSSNASEFFAKLVTTDEPIDLVVVDFQLPGLTGDKIVSWLRESENANLRTLPVLVITGYAHAFPKTNQSDRRFLRLLPKPYRFAQLEDAITQLLVNGTRH